MNKRSAIIAILTIILIPFLTHAAVTLKYFRVGETNDNAVKLEWETATEIDTALFILSRAESKDGEFIQIQTIPAEGDSVTGMHYQYIDENVEPGKVYWYKLEEQDMSGNVNQVSELVSSNGSTDEQSMASSTPEAISSSEAEQVAKVAPTAPPPSPPQAQNSETQSKTNSNLLLIIGVAALAVAAIIVAFVVNNWQNR